MNDHGSEIAHATIDAGEVPVYLANSGLVTSPDKSQDYVILEQIGAGGMGVVYKARNTRLNRLEAIKLIRSGDQASEREVARFRFEAEATAGLNHPNIVPVYGFGELDGRPFFAMKWIDGEPLADQAAALRKDPARLARVMGCIAQAVDHAHRQGILHRDLKPANILLDRDGEPHVTDFGLAKQFDAKDETCRAGLTSSGAVIGTPAYMAPEQARGERGVTTAADIYGLGTILYELLTGKPPFSGNSLPDVLYNVISEPPISPRARDPQIDRDLEAICLKCLEKDPVNRYATAAEVAADLENRQRGLPVSVRSTSVQDWIRHVIRRRPDFREGYAWEVKLWLGVLMAVVQPAVYAMVLAEVSILGIWAILAFACLAQLVILQIYMGAKFTLLPETEKHSFMIAVGSVLAQVGIALAYVPWTGPAEGVLPMYPAQAMASGLALFVIGTTHWGRFFVLGLGVMALVPLLPIWPVTAPLIYGSVMTACLWYWAYAVKVTFGAPSIGQAAGPEQL